MCTCFVIGHNSELKQCNNDHVQGIQISSHVKCIRSVQATEVEQIDEQKPLVLVEAIFNNKSVRTTNHTDSHWSHGVGLGATVNHM